MEIIKRGHRVWREVSKYSATCLFCKTEVNFTPDEIDKSSYLKNTVVCPLCHARIWEDDFHAIEWKIIDEIK